MCKVRREVCRCQGVLICSAVVGEGAEFRLLPTIPSSSGSPDERLPPTFRIPSIPRRFPCLAFEPRRACWSGAGCHCRLGSAYANCNVRLVSSALRSAKWKPTLYAQHPSPPSANKLRFKKALPTRQRHPESTPFKQCHPAEGEKWKARTTTSSESKDGRKMSGRKMGSKGPPIAPAASLSFCHSFFCRLRRVRR
jgi:hypothetical protein